MDKEKIPDWWILRCGCKTFITDYPFLSCPKCGQINCGNDEQLKKAKETGKLMITLKSGFGEFSITELEKELNCLIEDATLDAELGRWS